MKHRIGFNRLDRRQAHRKAMKNNMVTSLFRYERVTTTKAKAHEVKRAAEKLVTRARVDSVHNRRIVAEKIHDKEILAKLFTEIAPRYMERPGGYTRVLKTGFRQGDAAEMVILEFVDRKIEEKTRPEKGTAKRSGRATEVTVTESDAQGAKESRAAGEAPDRETAESPESETTERAAETTETAEEPSGEEPSSAGGDEAEVGRSGKSENKSENKK